MNKRWYIVHAHSNFEKKVAASIREQAAQRGLEDKFDEILVPTENVTEVRKGRKVNAERKFFPGYVLVKCDLSDDIYHLIKNTPKVTGFLGADKKPVPISDTEAERIKGQVQDGVERPKTSITLRGRRERSASPTARSPRSTARSRRSTRAARASRWRCRSSVVRRPVELEYAQVEKVCTVLLSFTRARVTGSRPARRGVALATVWSTRATHRTDDQRSTRTHGKKGHRLHQAAGAGGFREPVAADRSRARSARPEHHGILQGLQREDPADGEGDADPRHHHRLPGPLLHLRDEAAAGLLLPEAGVRHQVGLGDGRQGGLRRQDHARRRSPRSRRRRCPI